MSQPLASDEGLSPSQRAEALNATSVGNLHALLGMR